MDRDELLALATKHKTRAAIDTALRAYFKTAKGKKALASALDYSNSGLPRPMTVDVATEALLEEALSFKTKAKVKK